MSVDKSGPGLHPGSRRGPGLGSGPGPCPGPGPGLGPTGWCSTPCCSCPAAAAQWVPEVAGPPGRSRRPMWGRHLDGRGECAGAFEVWTGRGRQVYEKTGGGWGEMGRQCHRSSNQGHRAGWEGAWPEPAPPRQGP